jgi:hypothetical protein
MYTTTIIGNITYSTDRTTLVNSVQQVLRCSGIPTNLKISCGEMQWVVLGSNIKVIFSIAALKDIKELYPNLLNQIHEDGLYIQDEVEGYRELLLEIDFAQNIEEIQNQILKAEMKRGDLKMFLNQAEKYNKNIEIKHWGKEKIETLHSALVKHKIEYDDYVSIETISDSCIHISLVDIIKAKYV